GGQAVFVLGPDSTLELRPVEAGAYAADGVPVTSGLRPGEWAVAAGGHLLRDGMAVRAVDREGRSVRPGTDAGVAPASGPAAGGAPCPWDSTSPRGRCGTAAWWCTRCWWRRSPARSRIATWAAARIRSSLSR